MGGRPLTTTVSEKHLAMIFERSMELLTVVQSRVYTKLNPVKIVELFKLGEGQPPRLGIRCGDVVSGFYSFLGYTRLTTREVVQKAVARGIQEGVFGYVAGAVPALDAAGKYQVARNKVRFDVSVSDDEVDLESGFLMLPQAIPAEAVPQPGPGPVPPGPTPPPEVTPTPGAGAQPSSPTPTDKVVQLSFTANSGQIFDAWKAIANLADMAGKVEVSIRAESETGFDKSKLQNGVLEPLREIELID